MARAEPIRITHEDGVRAVELAREAVESFVLNGQREHPGSMRDAFYLRTGALVRLQSTRGRGRLRGYAGDVHGSDQLGHAIIDAAIEAASDESCGSEVEPAELQTTKISLAVVGDAFESTDPLADLDVGRHGVLVTNGSVDGWLYPTVPVENHWSATEYLDRTCRKARFPPNAWRDGDVTTVVYDAQVFEEVEPDGYVEAR